MKLSAWDRSMNWPFPVRARLRIDRQTANAALPAATASGWWTGELYERSRSG